MPDSVELDLKHDSVELDLKQEEITLEVVGEIGPRGPTGPAGPPGPPGPPGSGGGGGGVVPDLGALAELDVVTTAEIADDTITDADISSGAAIDLAKLAVDPLDRVNHTNTQLAATVSDFDPQVRTSRLDQMAIAGATLDIGHHAITNVSDPGLPADAVNKAYVDAVVHGFSDASDSVRLASTENLDITSPGGVIDGVAPAIGDRILLKNQTLAETNGIWTFNGDTAAMVRASDADANTDFDSGMYCFVTGGTENGQSGWVLTTPTPITLGATPLSYVQIAGGSGAAYVGTPDRIEVTGTQINIASTYAGQPSIKAVGTITSGTWQGTPLTMAYLNPNPLARANHSGTQLAVTISDFHAAVRSSRLDQMATPTASVGFGGHTITGVGTPVVVTDAATKGYVDASSAGSGIPPGTLPANSVLKADVTDVLLGLVVAPSTIVGRAATGAIAALKVTSDLIADGAVTETTIASGAVTDGKVTGPIDISKLTVDPLARGNHTGTQLAITIADFQPTVRANRLDQMATPTAPVGFGGQPIQNVALPTSGTDVATKAYVDSFTGGGLNPLDRANHFGTQLASTISNFDLQVRTSRLDQMATPTATVGFGGQILAGLATPANPTDAATKAYVDGSTGGIPPGTLGANSILKADIADLAIGLAVPPATVVGRAATGAITALKVDSDMLGNGAVTEFKIAGGAVTDGKIATGAVTDGTIMGPISISKLNVNPLARVNHTGTQPAITISDFDTAVRVNRLDQLTVPTGPVNFGGVRLTNVAEPTDTTDAVTKAYVDGVAGLSANILNANTILKADLDDTPVALAVAPSRFVGRAATGAIAALTPTQAKAELAIAATDISPNPLNRSNHAGTQLAATISDFDTQVRTSRLDQMADPTAAVSMNGQSIKNLTTPIASTDATNKAYVDQVAGGLDFKGSVQLCATTNVNIGTPGAGPIDGVTPSMGYRVLLAGQTTASQNGIYVFNGAASSMTRAPDADENAEVTGGMYTYVESGATNGSKGYVLATTGTIVLGTTPLAFTQFGGGSGAGGIPPGTLGANTVLKADVADTPVGLTVAPSTFVGRAATGAIATLDAAAAKTILAIASTDVSGLGTLATKNTVGSAEITDGSIAAGDLAVDPYARTNHTGTQLASTISNFDTQVRTSRLDQMATPTGPVSFGSQVLTNVATPAVGTDGATKAYVDSKAGTGKYITTIGNGTLTSFTVTHSLNTMAVIVEIYETATGLTVLADVTRTTVNAITVTGFTVAPTTNLYTVVVVG